MLLSVEHRFAFAYDAYISESFLELRVQPKTTPSQTVAAFTLAVGPPTRVYRYRDWNDNVAHHFTVTKFHNRIEIGCRSLVETHPAPVPLQAADSLPLPDLPFTLRDFMEFGGPVRLTNAMHQVHRDIAAPVTAPVGVQVAAIGEYLHQEFEYRQDVTRYDSTTDDFLKGRAGVCQDFTHLALGLLRLRGIPCRYVSGYVHVERPSGEPAQSHAWIEAYAPSIGWLPFDPTHNVVPDERYIVVGHGRHYDDVPPNRGIYRGFAKETLSANVRTALAQGHAAGGFHEEVVPIDLPAYTEVPGRRADRPPTDEDVAAQAQQQ